MNVSTCRVFLVDRPLRPALPNFCGFAAILSTEPGTARSTLAQPFSDGTLLATEVAGGVAERLIAPVLKTGRPKGLVSSNLTPSASLVASATDAGCSHRREHPLATSDFITHGARR